VYRCRARTASKGSDPGFQCERQAGHEGDHVRKSAPTWVWQRTDVEGGLLSCLPSCIPGHFADGSTAHDTRCVYSAHHVPEAVNHPDHYGGDTTYEAIKVIEAWGLDFCLGNAAKYIARAGKKDPERELEDLEKAAWYVNRRIEQLRGERAS
jgi:hypothetical protein